MNIIALRHIGIAVEHHALNNDFYEQLGFAEIDRGTDHISGRTVFWRKLTDGLIMIELIAGPGAEDHLAFTVDQVDATKYFYIAPSGHRVQFDRDSSGNLIELVEERKGADYEKNETPG